MTSIGGILGPIGFVKSLVSGIAAQNTRQIVWPVTDTTGTQLVSKDGKPQTSRLAGYVPILEEHRDELTITEHPVEQGAAITDHAYKLPARLTLRLGWSTSSTQANPAGISLLGVSLPTLSGFWSTASDAYVNQVYNVLQALMVTRTLLTVYTARRTYKNLLLQSLDLQTDDKTEHALVITAQLKEVILVSTQVITVPVNSAAQTNPQKTSPVTPQGSKSLQPANNFNPSDNTVST